MQEGKVVVWEGLTSCLEKKKVKGKGERERYSQLKQSSREQQRERDKKDFLTD